MIAIDILKPVGTGTGANEACEFVNTRSHASREHIWLRPLLVR
jgi:hypothetical protein